MGTESVYGSDPTDVASALSQSFEAGCCCYFLLQLGKLRHPEARCFAGSHTVKNWQAGREPPQTNKQNWKGQDFNPGTLVMKSDLNHCVHLLWRHKGKT